MNKRLFYAIVLTLVLLLNFCQNPKSVKEIQFSEYTISDNAQFWWARTQADINNDGIVDLILQNNNSTGGWLGWLEGTLDTNSQWKVHIISDSLEDGRKFAAGDLDVADFDGDGDIDVIGIVHPGEWSDAEAPAELFWFENPNWEKHDIGIIPNALKDINIADFNNDDKPDLITVNFEENYLTIFLQKENGEFEIEFQSQIKNLHEGMDVGDINGDGFMDIAANGYWFKNPRTSNTGEWEVLLIDSIWNNQTGDWSRNATKNACADIDGDGKAEVFISHSERDGYPVAMYSLNDEKSNSWEKKILIENLPAAHNMRIEDFNLDGNLEVLTGVNQGRAVNLEHKDFPLYIIQNNEGKWDTLRLKSDGSYNVQTVDFDNDGDIDIFRYPSHGAEKFFVMINQAN